jgi:hypothetical protein
MKLSAVLVAVVTSLTAISGCGDKQSRAQAPAAAQERSALPIAPSTSGPQRADVGDKSGNRPHESDSVLLQNMK